MHLSKAIIILALLSLAAACGETNKKEGPVEQASGSKTTGAQAEAEKGKPEAGPGAPVAEGRTEPTDGAQAQAQADQEKKKKTGAKAAKAQAPDPNVLPEPIPITIPEWKFASWAGKEINFFLTGNQQGELEPCACASNPAGGLAKRAYVLKRDRSKWTNLVLLDSGYAFHNGGQILPTQLVGIREKAAFIMKMYEQFGYSALNLSSSDIEAVGFNQILELARTSSVPIICSNILDQTGKTPFKSWISLEMDGVTIGVFGLLDDNVRLPEPYLIQDPVIAANRVVEEMRGRGIQLIVALTALPHGSVVKVGEKVEGIDLILGDREANLSMAPSPIGKSIFFGAGYQGKTAQLLRVRLPVPGKHPIVDRDEPQRLASYLEAADARLARMKQTIDNPPPEIDPASDMEEYRQAYRKMFQKRNKLAATIKKLRKPGDDLPFIEQTIINLDRVVDLDQETEEAVALFLEKYPQARSEDPLPTGPAVKGVTDFDSSDIQ